MEPAKQNKIKKKKNKDKVSKDLSFLANLLIHF